MERAIGQLKRRFHVLHGEVRLNPGKTCKVIYACAMLHNLCKDRNIPLPADDDRDDEDLGEARELADEDLHQHLPQIRNVGQMRNHFAHLHFKYVYPIIEIAHEVTNDTNL